MSGPGLLPGASEVLRGEKVYLRPPLHSELPYVQWLWADPATMTEVGGPIADFEGERAELWFAKMVDPGSPSECYCLIFAEDGRPVGEVSFHQYNPAGGTAIFNLKVQANERGKGYGPDAMLTLLRYFFGAFGGHVMLDPLALDNEVGQHTLLRFGFEHDPSVADSFMLRLSKERFEELYGA